MIVQYLFKRYLRRKNKHRIFRVEKLEDDDKVTEKYLIIFKKN